MPITTISPTSKTQTFPSGTTVRAVPPSQSVPTGTQIIKQREKIASELIAGGSSPKRAQEQATQYIGEVETQRAQQLPAQTSASLSPTQEPKQPLPKAVVPYSPITEIYKEPSPLLSYFERGATYGGKLAGSIFSIGGALDRPQYKTPSPLAPTVQFAGRTGTQATSEYRAPTIAEMTPEQKYEYATFKAQTSFATQQYFLTGQLQSKYQEKVDTGKLGVEEANKQIQEEYKLGIAPLVSKYKYETEFGRRQYIEDVTRANIPYSFAKGVAGGAITAVSLPVGLTLGAFSLASTFGTSAGRAGIKEQFTIAPLSSIGNLGAGFAGGLIGGYGAGALKAKYQTYAFNRDLNKALSKETLVGYKLTNKDVSIGKVGTVKDLSVRGSGVSLQTEQVSRFIGGGKEVGTLRVTQTITSPKGIRTTKVYEGIGTLKEGTPQSMLLSGIKFGETSNLILSSKAFVGKSNVQLISVATTYPKTYSLWRAKLLPEYTITKTYNAPFQKSSFGAISRKAYSGEGFDLYSIKGGKAFYQGKSSDFSLAESGFTRVRTKANINIAMFTKDISGGDSGGFAPFAITKNVPKTTTITSSSGQVSSFKVTTQVKEAIPTSAPAMFVVPKMAFKTSMALTFKSASVGAVASLFKIRQEQAPRLSLAQAPALVGRENQLLIPAPINLGRGGSGTILAQAPALVQPEAFKFSLITPQITRQVSPQITTAFTTSIFGIPAFLLTPKFSFDWGQGTRRIKGRKPRRKYTPSYEALILNIRGKQPKGRETGLSLRPIPKNFSWEFGRIKLKGFKGFKL